MALALLNKGIREWGRRDCRTVPSCGYGAGGVGNWLVGLVQGIRVECFGQCENFFVSWADVAEF